MKLLLGSIFSMIVSTHAFGQVMDIAAIYHAADDEVSHLLFENSGGSFAKRDDAFIARAADLAESHPQLTVAGDFTGDGLDELAVFYDLKYTPNMNPDFTCSVIQVSRSNGDMLIPAGTWFSSLDAQLNFQFVDFSMGADYNMDGLNDIALFYNDPSSDLLSLFVLESTGSGFTEPKAYYTVNRNEFNFTALKFACSGDFNGNGKPDIAVFYNYFGIAPETKQSIFIFESNENSFTLLSGIYNGTKQDCDFSDMKFGLSGDYNHDGYTDIAVLMKDPLDQNHSIPVFEGSGSGQMAPLVYATLSASEIDLSKVKHVVAGEFAGDLGSDLSLYYSNPGTGAQEILVLESESTGFKAPEKQYATNSNIILFDSVKVIRSGNFVHQAPVTATTWKDNRRGAVSFTFDDGYLGAFEHGAAELDAAGLKGTFYIFTDTVSIYDAALAGSSLIREYKNKGFEIGSHTSNHSNLGLLTENQDYGVLSEALSNSVDLLNLRFDQQTFSLSIPFGSFRYETLEYISRYFYTARSSQYGFNLASPYDFFALKSRAVLSSTLPAFIEELVSIAETYGYYLPLMYHDILDEPFNEDSLIYSYSKELFRETVQMISERDVWVDTHERIYKYIRERNALKVEQIDFSDAESQPGQFSFTASDGLADSIFNVELTLKIRLPDSWSGDTVTLGIEDSFLLAEVLSDDEGAFLLLNHIPDEDGEIKVYEGLKTSTGFSKKRSLPGNIGLTAFPNPFIRETQITIEGHGASRMHLHVLDLHGRMLKKIALNLNGAYLLDRDNLPPGLYIVQLFDGGLPVASLKLMAR